MRSWAWGAALWVAASFSAFAQSPDGTLPAQLTASQHTVLSAEISAKIDAISVKDGDRFKAGERLVVFNCDIPQAQMEEARATLAAAEKSKSVHKRLMELSSAGTLETEVAAAEAAKAQAKVNSARAVLSKCVITAPFPGRVVELKAQPHQYAEAGKPVLEILDDSVLEVEFIVPSPWLNSLKRGQAAQVLVDETGKSYAAKIIRIGAKVDAVSHSVKIVAAIDGAHPELMAGMTGRVSMTAPAKP